MTRTRTELACHKSALAAPIFKPVRPVDWDCLNRLSAYAAECRKEMGEELWAKYSAEWDA